MMSGISSRTVGDIGTNRLTTFGVTLTVAVVLAGSAAELLNYGFFNQRFPGLDPGSDGGVFGTIGDVALVAAAFSAWVLAARVRSARSVAVALAGLLTFLATDKVARLHDHIPHWLAFYLPVLVVSFICLMAIARASSGRLQVHPDRGAGRLAMDRLIGAGLLLLAFSFFLHVFGQRLLLDLGLSDTAGLAYQIKAVAKHGTEVAGWLLVTIGLLRFGVSRRRSPESV